ncbi:MAG: hypothetical protein ACQGVK_11330 [Myxococcota bacterium]
MKLRRVRVERLPGIDRPFALGPFEADVVLIVGPNGSGKSSLCRAVRQTLWPDAAPGASVTSEWQDDGHGLRAALQDGRVQWTRDGTGDPAPDLPDAHLAGCFSLGLRELLGHDEAGRDLDAEVRRQLGGGYDLSEARAPFERAARPQHGQKAAKALAAASAARRQEERAQEELGREQDRLALLRTEKQAAAQAARELEDWRKVGERAERLDELARLDGELAAAPPALARFQGGEVETLTDIEGQLDTVRRECEEIRARIDAAEGAQRDCAFDEGPPDAAALASVRERVRTWERAEERLARAREGLRAAEGEARIARAALAGQGVEVGDSPPPIDAEALARAETWLQERAHLAARRRELETRRALLDPGAEGAAPSTADAERLHRAADTLRHWLSEPAPPRAAPARVALLAAAVSGLGAAALWDLGVPVLSRLGVALDLPPMLETPWVAPGLAALAVVLLALGLSLAIRPRGARRRLEEEFAQWEVAAPEAWTREGVSACADVLDHEREALVRRQRDADESARITGLLAGVADEERQAEERRRRIVDELGVDPGADGLRLLDVARRVLRWRETRDAERSAQENVEACGRECAAAVDAARPALAAWSGTAAAPATPFEALAALDDLAARSEAWRTAEALRSEQERQLEGRIALRKRLAERRDGLFETLDLAAADPTLARHRLLTLAEQHPAYVQLRQQRDAARRELDRLEEALARRADWLALDAASAGARREQAEARARREPDLAAEIAAIEERVRQATRGGVLEERLAEEDAARADLAAAFDQRLDAAAALWLLDEVQAEHEREHSPAVLRQARSWFSAFTHHRYELEVDTGDASSAFRALDTERGVRCGLAELSDGTRAQLWLAARLAFAARAERGSPLPLFLDEALTSSDPERFRAVVEGLLVLSTKGHQIFYLTCDPVDVDHWQALCRELGAKPPEVIDLGSVRRGVASARGPDGLAPPARRAVPAPDGADAEDYGVRLGVGAPRPFESAQAWHLFHVLRDDLSLLHRILDGVRLDTLGQWRRARADGAARAVLAEGEARRVDARVELAEQFVEAWSIGRGRPLARQWLADCRSFNAERWLDEVDDLAVELGRDAAATLAALEAGRVSRFQKKAVAELRRELEEAGLLDGRPVLDEAAVRSRVLARMATPVGSDLIDLDEVHRRIDEWWAYLSGAAASRSQS